MWHCPWNWNNCPPNQSNWWLMCMSPTRAQHSLSINSRYSCNFLIQNISICHCLLMSPRETLCTFILSNNNRKYLAYWASGLIDGAVNENDQANTFFNYTSSRFPSWILIYLNESSGKNQHEKTLMKWYRVLSMWHLHLGLICLTNVYITATGNRSPLQGHT